MTGNGSLDLPAEEVTLAEALKTRGYATGLFGKWHHGPPRPENKTYTHPMDQGFDEFFGFTNATHAHQKFPKELFVGREKKPSDGYADTIFTDRAVDFVAAEEGQAVLPLPAVHRAALRHRRAGGGRRRARGEVQRRQAEASRATRPTRRWSRGMDKEVGRLLAALEEQSSPTTRSSIFTSDHGATFEIGTSAARRTTTTATARSAARSARSGRAASACRRACAGPARCRPAKTSRRARAHDRRVPDAPRRRGRRSVERAEDRRQEPARRVAGQGQVARAHRSSGNGARAATRSSPRCAAT